MTSHRIERQLWLLFIRLLLPLYLVLVAQSAHAHRFELGDAQLSIEGDTYQFAVSADLIEAFERHLGLNGTDRFLIEQVRGLDFGSIENALSEIRADISDETLIRFDGHAATLRAMSFPSSRDVRSILDQPPDNTEYRLNFVGYGDVP